MPPLAKLAYAWPYSPDCGIGRLAYCPWFAWPIGAIGGLSCRPDRGPCRPNLGLVPCCGSGSDGGGPDGSGSDGGGPDGSGNDGGMFGVPASAPARLDESPRRGPMVGPRMGSQTLGPDHEWAARLISRMAPAASVTLAKVQCVPLHPARPRPGVNLAGVCLYRDHFTHPEKFTARGQRRT